MNDTKRYAIVLALLILAFLAGRFMSPKEIQVREVEKIVESTRSNHDTVENVRETKLPDGTIIKETIKEEKISNETYSSKEREFEKVVKNQSGYSLGFYSDTQNHEVTIDRRLLGGLFIGGAVQFKGPFKEAHPQLGLRVEF